MPLPYPMPGGGGGSKGDPGNPGKNAFTTVAATYSWGWPNSGEPAYLELVDTSWMAVGQPIFVSDGVNFGTFTLIEIDPDLVTVTLEEIEVPTRPASGTPMGVSAKVTPGGQRGPAGA